MKKIVLVIFCFTLLIFASSCKKELSFVLLNKDVILEVGEECFFYFDLKGIDEDEIVLRITKGEDVIHLFNRVAIADAVGEAEIEMSIMNKPHIPSQIARIKVERAQEFHIYLSGVNELIVGESARLRVDLVNLGGPLIWQTSDPNILSVDDDGVVTAQSVGVAIIVVSSGEYSDFLEIIVCEEDGELMFKLGNNYQEKTVISWNEDFNPMTDIQAIDAKGNDVSTNIEITKNFNKQNYGLQTVELSVKDDAGNEIKMERLVEVVWDYSVTFIGHAGSFYGLMNSEEAFLYAVDVLKYQALECDLKQTSDGVFVMSHDDTFAGLTIASTSWDVLKDVEYTSSRNSGIPASNGSVVNSPYTTKLCTLERYLEICRDYNVKAVIELKSSKGITNSDQSRMQALMNEIEKANMLDDVIFLGSQYNCLIWTRLNNYESIPCQYLVNSFESETILNRCIDNDLDISINVTGGYSNNDEWLARYVEAGCKVSTYTFTQYVDYSVVQEWIDKGVDFVTCDWQLMSKLNLPKDDKTFLKTFNVTFLDYDGKVLKVALTKEGRAAASPTLPSRKGYTFTSWSADITNVKEDFSVSARYEINNYSLIYNSNTLITSEASWPTKADFIAEFYGDLYNWILENGQNIPEISNTNNSITMVKNGVTITFSNVEELKKINIYDFEKTISNLLYKPVTRLNDGSAIIEASEDYFLNSEAYREKYRDLDRWFVNCINNNYPAYDKTYQPTSAGKIQIMFRFHQWQQGTSIPSFNTLPKKYLVIEDPSIIYTLPENRLFTIEDTFNLELASGNREFLGWYLDKECLVKIEKIELGTNKNIYVYAKWA